MTPVRTWSVRRAPLLVAAGLTALGGSSPAAAQSPTLSAPGLGTLTMPTSARSDSAQRAFLRGVLLLHLFEYQRAEAAFRAAEAAEPGFAMATWGEAMTHTHPVWNRQDVAAGRAALARLAATPAARAAKAPTPREKAYLAAVEILYGTGLKARRDTLYSEAMGRLARAYPGDDQAHLFYRPLAAGTEPGGAGRPHLPPGRRHRRERPGARAAQSGRRPLPDPRGRRPGARRAGPARRPCPAGRGDRRRPRRAHGLAHLHGPGHVGRRGGGQRDRRGGRRPSGWPQRAGLRSSAATTRAGSSTATWSRDGSGRPGPCFTPATSGP